MNFQEIAKTRQSCRSYDPAKAVEQEKLEAVLAAGQLAPSACNSQPYHFTLCTGASARDVARSTQGMGMNKFTDNVPAFVVISEKCYSATAAMGSKVKKNDYRSIDIGIAAAYLTAEATAQGLGSCILGWFDDSRLRELCSVSEPIRLVIALGYAAENDPLRPKKRKELSDLVSRID